jgi:hypothetical protein
MAALRRPQRAIALIRLLSRTQSEQVALSTSLTGQALNSYFADRCFGVLPKNQLCRGVLILPDDHSDYQRGRHRQALRTNLRRAEAAGIRCESTRDGRTAFDAVTEIVTHRRIRLTGDQLSILAGWRAQLAEPEMSLLVARDRLGHPVAMTGAVIDDAVCLIRVAVANSHDARWALHDHLVRILIERGVSYLVAEGGGPFGALGFDSNVHHYQRLLGYELRHLKPCATWRLEPAGITARHVGQPGEALPPVALNNTYRGRPNTKDWIGDRGRRADKLEPGRAL